MENIWKIKDTADDSDIEHLSQTLQTTEKFDKTLSNLLLHRGIKSYKEAELFFRPKLDDLHDPFILKDMTKAIERLIKAIENNEKILIYGDYDVDGTTSVALVYSFLKENYDNLEYYIPNRYSEGYGISYKGIDYAKEINASLVIALDCGIKAIEKIKYATEKEIDFIICDHHTAGDEIPNAIAVIDPKRKDCPYPFKELSGCGVGFKLLQAYCLKKGISFSKLAPYLDLVCVSIASDIVPIGGENRILAHFGLKQLNENPRIGLKSIIEIAGISDANITISDSVFKIGPRINAAGRIESGSDAVKLLIADNEESAKKAGDKINKFNTTRKNFDQTITEEALKMISDSEIMQNKKSTVLYKPDWHKGVIGIVASRLTESYYKPTVILTESNGFATGSARSVVGFDLYNAIDYCSDLLEGFGGHKYAAGLTLKPENVEKFSAKFESYVAHNIKKEQLIPQIDIDAEIKFDSITKRFYRVLRQFSPFGPENMTPIFVTRNVQDTGGTRIVGNTKEHLKLDVIDETLSQIQGIGFGMAHFYENIKAGKAFDICYSVEENEFRGRRNLQLMVRDIKFRD